MPERGSRLDRYKPVIDGRLRDDLRVHRKQRHTAKRVFARLLEEHDAEGISYYIMGDGMYRPGVARS